MGVLLLDCIKNPEVKFSQVNRQTVNKTIKHCFYFAVQYEVTFPANNTQNQSFFRTVGSTRI